MWGFEGLLSDFFCHLLPCAASVCERQSRRALRGAAAEDDIFVFRGVRILGLGGSMEYIPGAYNQYTERRMERRIKKLWWKLKKNKGFDILVSHAPAYQINDMQDLPHQGFECFKDLMDKYMPKYFIHGHVHANYGGGFKREDTYGKTRVVNAYEYYIFDYPENGEQAAQ